MILDLDLLGQCCPTQLDELGHMLMKTLGCHLSFASLSQSVETLACPPSLIQTSLHEMTRCTENDGRGGRALASNPPSRPVWPSRPLNQAVLQSHFLRKTADQQLTKQFLCAASCLAEQDERFPALKRFAVGYLHTSHSSPSLNLAE